MVELSDFSFENNTDLAQQNTIEKKVEEMTSSSWTVTSGFSLTVGVSTTVEVPLVFEATMSMESEVHSEWTSNST